MTKSNELSVISVSYAKLISSIISEMQSGLVNAQKALEYARLQTYWEIGRHIRDCVSASNGAMHLSVQLYEQISTDLQAEIGLELSVDTIRRIVQFNKAYVKFPKNTSLTFSHYLVLQRVKDPAQRLCFEKDALNYNMSVMDLKERISRFYAESLPQSSKGAVQLVCERGEPFIYYVKQHEDLHQKKILTVDCGFKIEKALPTGNAHVKQGRCIARVVKTDDKYSLKMNQDLRAKRYTYAAVVTKIVDGDTIDACVDVGFGIWITDRFRLRGIDAFEMSDPKGRKAKTFIEGYLKQCPRIVIRTTKEGAYGRWLADIFALLKCDDPFKIAAEGEYLNQMLLDEGHAEIY